MVSGTFSSINFSSSKVSRNFICYFLRHTPRRQKYDRQDRSSHLFNSHTLTNAHTHTQKHKHTHLFSSISSPLTLSFLLVIPSLHKFCSSTHPSIHLHTTCEQGVRWWWWWEGCQKTSFPNPSFDAIQIILNVILESRYNQVLLKDIQKTFENPKNVFTNFEYFNTMNCICIR